jgi:hypothetical protein
MDFGVFWHKFALVSEIRPVNAAIRARRHRSFRAWFSSKVSRKLFTSTFNFASVFRVDRMPENPAN